MNTKSAKAKDWCPLGQRLWLKAFVWVTKRLLVAASELCEVTLHSQTPSWEAFSTKAPCFLIEVLIVSLVTSNSKPINSLCRTIYHRFTDRHQTDHLLSGCFQVRAMDRNSMGIVSSAHQISTAYQQLIYTNPTLILSFFILPHSHWLPLDSITRPQSYFRL